MLIPPETYHTCYLIYLLLLFFFVFFVFFFFLGGGGWGGGAGSPDLPHLSMDTKFRNQENR